MLVAQKTVFPQQSFVEPALGAARELQTHWLKEGSNQAAILDRVASSSDEPAIYSLFPTGDVHALRGSEYKVGVMPYRPFAEVAKTTLIPIVVAKNSAGKKRTYMLLDVKPSKDDRSPGTLKFIESNSSFSRKQDGAVLHQTHSLQALSLLSEKKMAISNISCEMDYTHFEQEKMKARVEVESAFCTAYFEKVAEYKVEDDARCNRNVVYTAIIVPESGTILTEKMLKRNYAVVDCTDEVATSSTTEKARQLARVFVSRMPTNFHHFKDEELVTSKVFAHVYKEIGSSRFAKPIALVCYVAIGLVSLFWFVRKR